LQDAVEESHVSLTGKVDRLSTAEHDHSGFTSTGPWAVSCKAFEYDHPRLGMFLE
jgi:hypothetical protein